MSAKCPVRGRTLFWNRPRLPTFNGCPGLPPPCFDPDGNCCPVRHPAAPPRVPFSIPARLLDDDPLALGRRGDVELVVCPRQRSLAVWRRHMAQERGLGS